MALSGRARNGADKVQWAARLARLATQLALIFVAATAGAALSACGQADAPVAPQPSSSAPPQAGATAAAAAGKHGKPKSPEQTHWKDLSAAQQQALAPLAPEWDQLEPLRRQKWLAIVKRYASMNPDEQARVQERMRAWVEMTPEERRQVRQNFARAQKIDPTQKSTQWESYQQLPEEQKKELAAKAAMQQQVANLPTPAQSKIKMVAPIKPLVPMPTVAPTATPAVTPPVTPALTQPPAAAGEVTLVAPEAANASNAANTVPALAPTVTTPPPAAPAPTTNTNVK